MIMVASVGLGSVRVYAQGSSQTVLVTVIQKKANVAAKVSPGSFSAFGNQNQPIPIVSVSPATSTPIHFALLIDEGKTTQTSTKLKVALEQAEEMFTELLQSDGGDVSAYAFADSTELLVNRTSDMDRLHASLSSIRRRTKINLFDAIAHAMQAAPRDRYRRIAIVISSGGDWGSRTTEGDVIKMAHEYNFALYFLNTQFRFHMTHESYSMERARKTGGRLLFPENEKHVQQSFEQLQADLAAQYWITLGQPTDKLKLETRQKGIKLLYPH